MFAAHVVTALLVVAGPLLARADVGPSEPGPGDKFDAGQTCHISWDGDAASTTSWKDMSIELMSGDNFNMVHLTTVASNQDGTVAGTFDYPCPEVNPYSNIYFYQFSSPSAVNKTWTTRFTIASPSGATTPPANALQPTTNAAIPWGVGQLVDASAAVAAPPPSLASPVAGAPASGSTTPANTAAPANTPANTAKASTPTTFATVNTAAPAAATNAVTSNTTSANTTTDKDGSSALALNIGSARVLLGAAVALVAVSVW